MTIYFSPTYTSSSYMDLEALPGGIAMDTTVCDIAGLVSLIELHSGKYYPERSVYELRVEYMKALKQMDADNPDNVLHKSLEIDAISTAKACLAWREKLVLAGWTSDMMPSPRLQALADAEAYFAYVLTLSDRVMLLPDLIRSSNVAADIHLVIPYDHHLMHPAIIAIVDALKDNGARVEVMDDTPIPSDCNLKRLADWYEGIGDICDITKPDDTVKIIEFENREKVIAWLATLPKSEHEVWISDHCADIDRALIANDKPACGSMADSGLPSTVQMAMLAVSLFMTPVDINKLVAWLRLPNSPMPGVRFKIASAILSNGGYDPVNKQECLDDYQKNHPDVDMDGVKKDLDNYLYINTGHDASNNRFKKFIGDLTDWAEKKAVAEYEPEQRSQYANLIGRLKALLMLADMYKSDTLKNDTLEKWMMVCCDTCQYPQYTAQDGAHILISNPSNIIEKMHCFDVTDLDECCERSLDLIDDAYKFDGTDQVMTPDELKQATDTSLTALLSHCPNVGQRAKRERIMGFCRETINVVKTDKSLDLDFFRTKVLATLEKETFGAGNVYQIPQTLDLAEKIKKAFYFSPESLDKMREYVKRIFQVAKTWKESYLKYKDEHHVLDFNDIERKTLQLLNMPEVRADIQASYRYLMVDEFQDSNSEQIKIFNVLAGLVTHSWWVGDSKQAIYAFRGSNTELVDDTVSAIIKGVDGCDRENLPDSHRSVPELVKFANDVFSIAFAGQQNVCLNAIKSQCPHIDPLKWYSVPTKNKSKVNADYIADMVASMITDSNYSKVAPLLDNFAILTRWNADIPKIADALRVRGIPSSYKVPVCDSREWRLMSALLSLCDNDNLLARATVAHLVAQGYDLTGIIESKLDYDQNVKTGLWLDDVALIGVKIRTTTNTLKKELLCRRDRQKDYCGSLRIFRDTERV